jgi:hypothetical protein
MQNCARSVAVAGDGAKVGSEVIAKEDSESSIPNIKNMDYSLRDYRASQSENFTF